MDALELVVTWSRCCRATSAFCLATASPAWPALSASFSSLEFLSSAWGKGQNACETTPELQQILYS